MRDSTELMHVSRSETIVALLRMRDHYQRAKETAECRLDESEACPEPRPDWQCEWGPTKFCAARLKLEAVESVRLDQEMDRRRRIEKAQLTGIPKWAWGHIGVVNGIESDSLRETEALRFVRYTRENDIRLVILNGNDGTGKSTAAALWAWTVSAWYYRATNLRWFTRGGFNQNPGDIRLLSAPAVAIVGLDKPWAAKDGSHKHSLVHICYERIDAGRRTLITSNLAPVDLESVLGSGLMRHVGRYGGMARLSEQVDGESTKGAF